MSGGRPVDARVNSAQMKAVARDLRMFGPDAARKLKSLEGALTEETIRRARAWAGRIGRQQIRAASTLTRPARGAGAVLPGTPLWNAGAEFGSNQFRQFPRWRGKGSNAGYFLFPALSEVNMMQQSSDAIAALVKDFNNGR